MKQIVISTKGPRKWQGIPAIEGAANRRLWCAFFTGGNTEPAVGNYLLLTASCDEGATWSEPAPVAVPSGSARTYDPALWHDPSGRLWLFYNLADLTTKEFSVWAMTTDNSGDREPRWSAPRRIDLGVPFAFRLNKPTVLTTGEWLLPVTWSATAPEGWFAGAHQVQGVAISPDRGATWTLHGGVQAPPWALENMIVERRDGGLWMLIRTGAGVLWQSFSGVRGRTWSSGSATNIVNPGVRFFIRRLASGRLLLINTPDAMQRKSLYAYLSNGEDDSLFGPGVELDGRDKVSYPDAIQFPDGLIFAVHDCDRQGSGEILLNVFSESEIPVGPALFRGHP